MLSDAWILIRLYVRTHRNWLAALLGIALIFYGGLLGATRLWISSLEMVQVYWRYVAAFVAFSLVLLVAFAISLGLAFSSVSRESWLRRLPVSQRAMAHVPYFLLMSAAVAVWAPFYPIWETATEMFEGPRVLALFVVPALAFAVSARQRNTALAILSGVAASILAIGLRAASLGLSSRDTGWEPSNLFFYSREALAFALGLGLVWVLDSERRKWTSAWVLLGTLGIAVFAIDFHKVSQARSTPYVQGLESFVERASRAAPACESWNETAEEFRSSDDSYKPFRDLAEVRKVLGLIVSFPERARWNAELEKVLADRPESVPPVYPFSAVFRVKGCNVLVHFEVAKRLLANLADPKLVPPSEARRLKSEIFDWFKTYIPSGTTLIDSMVAMAMWREMIDRGVVDSSFLGETKKIHDDLVQSKKGLTTRWGSEWNLVRVPSPRHVALQLETLKQEVRVAREVREALLVLVNRADRARSNP